MGSKLKINKKENKNISHNPQAESVHALVNLKQRNMIQQILKFNF